MRLSELLVRYRKEHGLSQRKFAEMCGVTNSYISMLENEMNPHSGKPIVPTIEKCISLADGMGLSLHEMFEICDDFPVQLGGTEDDLPGNLSPVQMKKVPLLGSIAAGEPILAEQEYDTYIEADEDVRCDYALRVDGDSMEPTVRYGDLVFIRQQDDVDDGQIAAVLIDDSATLKRVYHIPNGLQLISENPKYAARLIAYPDFDAIRILGRAVAYKRLL